MSWASGAELLRKYGALAHHRTGTTEDATTLDLVEEACRAGGATVRRIPFDFSLYDWRATVALDGNQVQTLPLYYSAVGEYSLTDTTVAGIKVDPGEDDALLGRISQAVNQARAAGAQRLVVATNSATSGLYAPNVSYAAPGTFPVWLIGAADARSGLKVEARLEASVRPARSATLVADYGADSIRPALVITTPMSGWFACVGERGGGLLLALKLCEKLSGEWPVRLLATSGHELGHLGAGAARTDCVVPDDVPVLHLGSCVATPNAELQTRFHANGPANAQLEQNLRHIGGVFETPSTPADPASWRGESSDWASASRAMVSVAGVAPAFHTPQDRDVASILTGLVRYEKLLENAARILCRVHAAEMR